MKGFKLGISKIAHDTFKTGQNKFAAQFMQLQKNVVNYLQRTLAMEGYLVAETVHTKKNRQSTFPLLLTRAHPMQTIKSQGEEVKTIAKRRLKLVESLKEGYATIYNQCLQKVKDKLEATNDWETMQRDQSLHELISKIERICMGFDDHKQAVLNLVQALKTLFLYSQSNKETVEEYGRNFCSLWDSVEAFRGLPGTHKGITDGMLKDPNHVVDVNRPSDEEKRKAEDNGSEAVKAALLISGADKQWYGWLKNELANNYLLGPDQYLSNFDKALCILGNCHMWLSG
jgi:hypothetical protein